MVTDPEKADLAAQQPIPRNNDGLAELPAPPVDKDDHEKSGNSEAGISMHSHSSIVTAEPASRDPDQGAAQDRSKSRTSSTRSRALTIVPRSKRRGLLGRFAIVPEVERPFDYKRSTKWFITAVVALAAAAAPMGSAIFLRKLLC